MSVLAQSKFAPEDEYGFNLSRNSLQKRLERLEDQLAEAVFADGLAVFDYRLFNSDDTNIKMGTIGKALANFQIFFSTVFDAIKHGPKLRANFDSYVAERSAFQFVDAYQGSAGLLFTIKTQAELFRTDVEKAMRSVFSIIKSPQSEDINTFAKTFGVAAVRKLYVWANDHALSGVGADLQWQASRTERESAKISIDKFSQLKSSIEKTSEEKIETLDMYGLLVGADTQNKTFHVHLPSNKDIHGGISNEVPSEKYRQLDKSYNLTIRKRTVVYYATEKETAEYTLLNLF